MRFGDETNLSKEPEGINEQRSFQERMKKSVEEALKVEKRDKPEERQNEGKKIGFQPYQHKEYTATKSDKK